ncbi:hypothetical protein, partial [Bacillus norwichensis]|uniref:hypothetical protein n=1 Tax=Bacillus norwichensis TaxID=2762217 RepID=UPI001CD914AD
DRGTLLGLAGRVVRLANFSVPFQGWPATKAFSRRANHPFSRVVLIVKKISLLFEEMMTRS